SPSRPANHLERLLSRATHRHILSPLRAPPKDSKHRLITGRHFGLSIFRMAVRWRKETSEIIVYRKAFLLGQHHQAGNRLRLDFLQWCAHRSSLSKAKPSLIEPGILESDLRTSSSVTL